MKRLRMLAVIAMLSVVAIFFVMTGLSRAYVESARKRHVMEYDRQRSIEAQQALWVLDAFVAGMIVEYSSQPLPAQDEMGMDQLVAWKPFQDQRVKLDFLCDALGTCSSTVDKMPEPIHVKMRSFSAEWEELEKNLKGPEIKKILRKFDDSPGMIEKSLQCTWLDATQLSSQGKDLLQTLWVDQFLLLARKTNQNGKEMVQGFWLDWERIESKLMEQLTILMPHAELLPEYTADEPNKFYRMATLPVFLDPNFDAPPPFKLDKPLKSLLAISWGTAGMASMALMLWVTSSYRLSRRRFAFASAVSHELRTPLTSFQLYTEMLNKEFANQDGRTARHVRTLHEQSQRLQRMVSHVMAYARLERGMTPDETVPMNLREGLDRAMEQIRLRLDQSGMELDLDFPEALSDLRVQADPGGVEQILINLIDNAVKYAGDATDKRIHLRISRSGRQAHIDVIDHGPGLSPSQRRKCFRPFMKSVHQVTETQGGLGLGLAISRGLVRRMGGRLTYNQPPNSGAGFRLTLPVT